jgi:type VII secretion-associated serine protease mycosin
MAAHNPDRPRDSRALTGRRSDKLRDSRALTGRRSNKLRGGPLRVRVAHMLLALGVGLATSTFAVLAVASPAHADWVRNDQWQLTSLHATAAWSESTGAGVTVAVLDSGVDANHVDLKGQVLPGADFVDGTTDGRRDPVGHGTTVAALIAGRADDTFGVEGVAPGAKILPVRVLDPQNRYRDAANVAKALRWAVDHGADVVNMSLGGGIRSPALADAIDYAYQHGVVVVACTGNQIAGGSDDVWYPAREPGVVAVAGLAEGGIQPTLWSGTLTGPDTVLVAPAVNMLGAKPGGYWRVQGTSFAAPLVAATAALVRARWPGMDAANVINRLINTADDLGPPGRDDQYGYGEVDPVAALTDADLPQVRRNPLLPQSAVVHATQAASGNAEGAGGPVPDDSPIPAASLASPAAPHDDIGWGVAAGGLAALGCVGTAVLLRRRHGGSTARHRQLVDR